MNKSKLWAVWIVVKFIFSLNWSWRRKTIKLTMRLDYVMKKTFADGVSCNCACNRPISQHDRIVGALFVLKFLKYNKLLGWGGDDGGYSFVLLGGRIKSKSLNFRNYLLLAHANDKTKLSWNKIICFLLSPMIPRTVYFYFCNNWAEKSLKQLHKCKHKLYKLYLRNYINYFATCNCNFWTSQLFAMVYLAFEIGGNSGVVEFSSLMVEYKGNVKSRDCAACVGMGE